MAGRNDAALYTAQNGSSFTTPKFAKQQEKRSIDKEQRLELQNKLFPAAELIFEMLSHEEQLITVEIANMPITVATSNENVKEMLLSYQRNLRMIKRLRKKFERALARPTLTPEEIDAVLEGFEDDDDEL